MKRTICSVFAAAALWTLAACSADAASKAIGKYTLDVEAMMASMPGSEAMPAEAKEMMKKSMKGSIELQAEGKFLATMTMPVLGEKSMTGTWKIEGDKVSMTGKEEGGAEETKTATYKDGVLAMEEEQGGNKVTMTFRKAK